jgi:phosphoserine/homoserine phosphotransferase
MLCCDLEGVLVPEVWINVARWTGIDELKLTTRDIVDYNALMKRRLEILKQHGITINDIQKVISLLNFA